MGSRELSACTFWFIQLQNHCMLTRLKGKKGWEICALPQRTHEFIKKPLLLLAGWMFP